TTARFVFTADTPIGRIAIGGAESGLYDEREAGFEGAWALLVDLGGDDDYRVPVAGNSTRDNSVSVMIDLAGDDRYGYVEVPHALDGARLPSDAGGRYTPTADPTRDNGPVSLSEVPRQGGARLGTAVLVDLGAGRDVYRSLRVSQGAGVLGAGVLVDDGGDDDYAAEAFAQGAGALGLGLLFDGGGRDVRRAYQLAQGFAYAFAAGLLYDVDGDDEYLMDVGDPAHGGDPLYFSAQRPGAANSTLGQGFGFGRRADSTDRGFMSGGVGLLVDGAGDDRYEGSIFAQGGGYWFGTGILADRTGRDSYDALWYAMGTGAHYALGMLFDGAGDDRYGGALPRVNVTIAGGHDFSVAVLVDESGDDRYDGSRITLGAGNVNGVGLFADNGGRDEYSANGGYSFGAAGLLGSDVDFVGSARRAVDSIGLFLDRGGLDGYTRAMVPAEGVGDDAAWTQTQNADPDVQRTEKGAGVDAAEGETTLHTPWHDR
ncbi:hypothetical protein L6R52_26820, partial [Myxococcota bacterium]|nr:hypothetical protein [Myxococcota bacterium]